VYHKWLFYFSNLILQTAKNKITVTNIIVQSIKNAIIIIVYRKTSRKILTYVVSVVSIIKNKLKLR
ncbi:hypothetical protein DKZ23_08235, partial [Limosilactobacillus reuteri]